MQICCAAKKNILTLGFPTCQQQQQKEGVGEGSISSCWVFHLAGIVCQTQNFVFSHSRRRRHVRGLWIITLKTAKEREKETDKRKGE